MYTLLTGLYRRWTRREEFHVIILGLDNAGKTTLLEQIKAIFTGLQPLAPERIAPTIGLNIGRIDLNKLSVKFWDLGGQVDLHPIWEKYYPDAHAVVFLIDSTDLARFELVRTTFEKVISNGALEGLPVLMLANKQDLPGALRVEQIKEFFNPIAVTLDARDSKVLPCVALSGNGVREAVDWLHLRMQRNRLNRPPSMTPT